MRNPEGMDDKGTGVDQVIGEIVKEDGVHKCFLIVCMIAWKDSNVSRAWMNVMIAHFYKK